MSNILHIIQCLSLGGAARSMIATSKYSSRFGSFRHSVISLLPAQPDAIELAKEAGMSILSAPDKHTFFNEIEKADIVHVNWWNNPEIYELLRSELPPMRLMIWYHVAGNGPPQIITPQLVNYADMNIPCNPFTYNELPIFRDIPHEKKQHCVEMVYDAADFERLKGIKLRPHNHFNVGYIGTVDFVKMHKNYIRMSASVDVPDVKFIVCGGGIQDQLRNQAMNLGVEERFDFRGYVNNIKSVIEILDIYGYPLCEGTYAAAELTLQEVMYAGIPPVVFPYGGIKQLVKHEETGLVIHSESEYKEAIEYLFHHPEERTRLGRNALEYAKQIFGAENAAKKLNCVYEKMMRLPKKKRKWNSNGNLMLQNQVVHINNINENQKSISGADKFVEALGNYAQDYITSMHSQNIHELFKAEKSIASSHPLLSGEGAGGIHNYKNVYQNDGFLRLWSGLILQQKGNHAEAVTELASAAKFGCNHWRVFWYLAQSAEKLGNYALTKEALQIVTQSAPEFIDEYLNSPELLNLCANLKSQEGKRSVAREILNNLLNKWPANTNALNNLAEIEIFEKNWEKAAELLQRVLEHDTANDTALKNIQLLEKKLILYKSVIGAEKIIEQKQYSEAREILKKILEIDNKHVDALNNLAVIEIIEKNFIPARNLLEKVLNIDSTNEIALENIACINRNRTSYSTAIANESSVKIDVSIVIATKNRAKLLDEMLTSLKSSAQGVIYEVIVVAGGSSDNTLEVLRKHGINQIYNELEYFGEGKHSWPQLYNFGFSKAQGKWAMYASDDILFVDGCISHAIELLNKQNSNVAGGIFFYKNAVADPGWDTFGIDFTYGQKLLMNYGLLRRESFCEVNGLNEVYKFYCADGDLCYKLYERGKKLIPLPQCLVIHNNILDSQKKSNLNDSKQDIEIYAHKWKHFVSIKTPEPRRLFLEENLANRLDLKDKDVSVGIVKAKQTLKSNSDFLEQLRKAGVWTDGQPLKLHLGCGERHLEDYINIDYPPSEHNVMQTKADIYANIMELDFPSESVDEVRLHHVFEHFNRVMALAMIIKWHKWLKIGGKLHIETPDLLGSAKTLTSNAPWEVKMSVVRHLAGDQSSNWGYHIDHWFPERFQHTLEKLGFGQIQTQAYSWNYKPYLSSVEVTAVKTANISIKEQLKASDELLWESTIDSTEERTHKVWSKQLHVLFQDGSALPSINIPLPNIPLETQIPLSEIQFFNSRNRDKWMAEKASTVPAGSIVLDVGAGASPYRSLFAHCDYKTHDFKKYEGPELEYGKIDYVSDIAQIPLPDNSLDVIVCTEVLEHVTEPIKALQEMSRILRPEGRLLLTAPLCSGLHQLPYHYYGGYTPEWYKYFCKKMGLNIKEITPNGGFFKMLAQECVRVTWTLDQHKHLHGENVGFVKYLFGEWIPKYLFALDQQCFIDQFTVGYHLEAVKIATVTNLNKTEPASRVTARSTPIVSIFIPVYNGEKYLGETLDSLIAQTFKDFEIVIVNDGSTDRTLDIAQQYALRDDRIRIVCHERNMGLSAARNTGWKSTNSQSKYLMNHDSDDISLSNKVARLVDYLERNPATAAVGSFAEYFDDAGNNLGSPPIEWLPDRIRQTFGEVNSMPISATLVRREMYETIAPFRNEYGGCDDYDFWSRALIAGFDLANIPEVLHKIRIHSNSMGATKNIEMEEQAKRIRQNYLQQQAFNKYNEKCIPIDSGVINLTSSGQYRKVTGKGLKIHLGCGDIKVFGFINVDIDASLPAVDVVDDVSTLSRFHTNSASLIYACHILEHFSHDEIVPILKRWHDLLEPGGELRISVPDIDRIVTIYHKNWQHFQTPPNSPWIGLIYGGQLDKYDLHKTGFNFVYLKYLLEQAGFIEISEYPHAPHWLGIQDASLANEPFKEYLSLNIKAKKPKGRETNTFDLKNKDTLDILHTVEFYYPRIGGAESVVQHISERLAKRGHHVSIATTKLEERTSYEINGVNIHEFSVKGSIGNGIHGKDIELYKDFLLSHPANVVMNYAAQQWATDLAFSVIGATVSRRVNVIAPCGYSALVDSQTLRWPQFATYFSNILPKVLPLYDAAVYHSSIYKDYEFAQRCGLHNSIIIPNGVCEEEFSRKPKIHFREKYHIVTEYFGLCVANFYEGKGQERVIECVKQMNRTDFTMVFIGKEGAQLSNLKTQAAGMNVQFFMDIPREDTLAAYHEADIFLFGSHIEASPLVIIEAKASKTPFVSTDCGNVREWKGGIVCAPEDMAIHANNILDNESLRIQLVNEGYREWKEKLTWESIVDKYEDLYVRLLREKRNISSKITYTQDTKSFSKSNQFQDNNNKSIIADLSSVLFNKAEVFFQKGAYNKAINNYKKAIESNPSFYDAYDSLAIAYAKVNQTDNAIIYLEKAIRLRSGDASVYNNLGVLYFKKGMCLDAKTYFEIALLINVNYREAQQNLEKVDTILNETSPTEKTNQIIGLIFSKDRAMQLDGTLRSFSMHCKDAQLTDLTVIYKTSNASHDKLYDALKKEYSNVLFIKEGDFKEQVLSIIRKYTYILFLVDDNIFLRNFYISDLTNSLNENKNAIGFSLRLGENTVYCYALNAAQKLPMFSSVEKDILKYDWVYAEHDFGYPLEVSSSVYRVKEIYPLLAQIQFSNPNTLEGQMAANKQIYVNTRPVLLCGKFSFTFCAPLNIVQNVCDNRVGSETCYSSEALANKFGEGYRIDVEKYINFTPNACHQEVPLELRKSNL